MSRGLTVGFNQVPLTLTAAKGLITVAGPDARFSANAPGTVATPTILPVPGSYIGTQTITITCTTPASSLYYTTDGTSPTFPITGTTQLYTGTFTIASSSIVSAIGAATGLLNSSIASSAYTITGSGAVFDFYISPTGSDSNAGSLASPWAITAINTHSTGAGGYAGKRLGLLPGTYDVSGLMYFGSTGGHSTALMINGGPNSSTLTYIGSSNSSGQYQAGTAILDAKGASGFYGGSNTNNSTVIGSATGNAAGPASPTNWGNWTLDGIGVKGFSYWAIQVGSYDANGGLMPNVIIQNCSFYDSTNANAYTGTGGVHAGPMELYQYNGCQILNCWFYNNRTNTSNDRSHFAAITSWGFSGLGNSINLTIKQCSFVDTCGLYGINDTGPTSGTIVTQCYFDMTNAAVANGLPCGQAIMGFGSSTAGLSPSFFSNNVVRGGGVFDGWNTDSSQIWANNFTLNNNTWDMAGGAGFAAASMGYRAIEAVGHTGICKAYNNLTYDDGATNINPYGYFATNPDIFSLCDYNIYGVIGLFNVYGTNGGTGGPTNKTFNTWAVAIGGLEAHSSTSAVNPFTNTGILAFQYTVQSGSPAFGTGRVGGVSSGAVCNVGAWDGTVIQIGSNLPQPT